MGVAFDNANHDLVADLVFLVLQVRAQNVQSRIHRVGAQEQFRDEILLRFKEFARAVHALDQAVFDGAQGVNSLVHGLDGESAGAVFVHADDGIGKSAKERFSLVSHNWV